jgi:hypothetical protein
MPFWSGENEFLPRLNNTDLKVTIFLYKITTAAVKIVLKYCFVFEEIVTNMLLCRSQLFFFGTELYLFRRIFVTN